jgi:hypothetical protein
MKKANAGSHGPKGGGGNGPIGGGRGQAALFKETSKQFTELSALFAQLAASVGTPSEEEDKGSYAAAK